MPVKSSITFTVSGVPVPKGRPRFARHGGRVLAFTDKKTTAYEQAVGFAASAAMGSKGPLKDAIMVDVDFGVKTPKKLSKPHPVGVPDLDNLVKAVLDGMQGVVFVNDAQVVDIKAVKQWGGLAPYTRVVVRVLPPTQVLVQNNNRGAAVSRAVA